MNKEYEKALRNLPGTKEHGREYREYIAKSIDDYLSGSPDATEEEIAEFIGSPEQVRAAYMDGLSEEERRAGEEQRGKSRRLRTAVAALVLLPLVFFAGRFCYRYFFPEIDIVISRPVNQEAEHYVEYPSVGFQDTALGMSARKAYEIEVYSDQVRAFVYEELYRRYGKNPCHIECKVENKDGCTVTTWYGTATNMDGQVEEVYEERVVRFILDPHPEGGV